MARPHATEQMQCVIGAPLLAGIGVSKSLSYIAILDHSCIGMSDGGHPAVSERLLQVMTEWAKLLRVVRKGVRRQAR